MMSRLNEGTGSKVFNCERQPSYRITSQTKSPYLRNATDYDLTSGSVPLSMRWLGERIVGGRITTIEEFPYMASLHKEERHLCSLCIITDSWLLTAGHCTIDPRLGDFFTEPTDYTVIAGSTFQTNNVTGGCVENQVVRNVNRLVWHPNFTVISLLRDLVLVGISRPLPFTHQIMPASLPAGPLSTERDLTNGSLCYVAGWGKTDPQRHRFIPRKRSRGTAMSVIKSKCMMSAHSISLLELQKVKLPILSISSCTNMYPWAKSWLEERDHICTLSTEGKDACSGDSGGPLVCGGTVVGLVSWGLGCANETNPTVYTRIDTHMRWIMKTTDLWKRNQKSRAQRVVGVIALGPLAMAITSFCQAL